MAQIPNSMVEGMIEDIKQHLSQKSSSVKDEIAVMQAMLNDPDYKVSVYGKNGTVEGQYCPSEDAKSMVARVISSATKINTQEATSLADNYQFNKADAKTFVNVSKEFIHTYVQTGRKLPLGAREDMDVSLEYRTVPERDTGYPRKIGVDAQGKDIYEITSSKIPAHGGIKASSPCPPWIKE